MSEEYPNVLEKTLLEWPHHGWFRTVSCNEAFTLSYGRLQAEPYSESPENELPCHWRKLASFVTPSPDTCDPEDSDLKDSDPKDESDADGSDTDESDDAPPDVIFYGTHFGAIHFNHVSKSGCDPRYSNGGKVFEKVITSKETLELRQQIRKIYMDTDTNLDCILAKTYSSVIRPQLLRTLEKKYCLGGGTWYMLPSDCYCCT